MPRAASPPHALITRRRCCPTARCWWRGEQWQRRRLLTSAELYDPASGTWSATGSLTTARDVSHGDVAAQRQGAGGGGISIGGALSSAELYDPASGTWSATGSLNTARLSHTATLLPNGKVLVAGGLMVAAAILAARNCTTRPAGRGRATGSLATAATAHTATLLPNGKVLVAGGWHQRQRS